MPRSKTMRVSRRASGPVFGLIGFSLLSQEIWGFELVEPPQPISPAVVHSITSSAATIRRRPDVGRGPLEASVSDRDRQLRRRASILLYVLLYPVVEEFGDLQAVFLD